MVYTTACENCRKVRMKCIRPSQGRVLDEVCERCKANDKECTTLKRRVGRQAGVKNRRRKDLGPHEQVLLLANGDSTLSSDADHLPNPLHVLASEAVRRQPTPEGDELVGPSESSFVRSSDTILDRYSELTATVGRDVLTHRLDALLSTDQFGTMCDLDEPGVLCGRIDMARPDAAPENDVISLQMISLPEAQHLFDSFMELITNGAMYFDPRLHTLTFVRQRSSFLLAVILAVASTYTSLCPSGRLHAQLMAHAISLEAYVRNEHLKSIEIVQGLLLIASWTPVPTTLAREKTWLYVSHAIALAVELRLDSSLPYCVQSDPMYTPNNHDTLVRNAHRVCLLMFIHDWNMAMVAGRYPIYPESDISSVAVLNRWGKHAKAGRFDAPICASVSLRKLVNDLRIKLGSQTVRDLASDKAVINQVLVEWRTKWAVEITSTLEYDIIARFSTFVLALTLTKKKQYAGTMEVEARQNCERMAFEVCCASIKHYKSWKGLLNSATFDTSMVAFCAIYTIQSINHSSATHLSDWSLFRLATLQELVSELESQAAARHSMDKPNSMSVVDAMAQQLSRGLRLLLNKKHTGQPPISVPTNSNNPFNIPESSFGIQDPFPTSHISPFDELNQFMISNNALPFIPEWNLESLLPEMTFPWDNTQNQSLEMPMFGFS